MKMAALYHVLLLIYHIFLNSSKLFGFIYCAATVIMLQNVKKYKTRLDHPSTHQFKRWMFFPAITSQGLKLCSTVLVCWSLPHPVFFCFVLFFWVCDWSVKLRFHPFIPLTGHCHNLVYKAAASVSLPSSCTGTIYLLSVPTALIALQV